MTARVTPSRRTGTKRSVPTGDHRLSISSLPSLLALSESARPRGQGVTCLWRSKNLVTLPNYLLWPSGQSFQPFAVLCALEAGLSYFFYFTLKAPTSPQWGRWRGRPRSRPTGRPPCRRTSRGRRAGRATRRSARALTRGRATRAIIVLLLTHQRRREGVHYAVGGELAVWRCPGLARRSKTLKYFATLRPSVHSIMEDDPIRAVYARPGKALEA